MAGRRAGLWVTIGSVLSAALASACCWLPLLLIAFGVSASGVSAAFAEGRPLFLGIAVVLLGSGFYVSYFRKEACTPGSACAVPNTKLERLNRAMLWIATVAVLAFAFFPSYVGLLLASSASVEPTQRAEAADAVATVTIRIEGMTCEGCATGLAHTLNQVPGVVSAQVSYADQRARVGLSTTDEVMRERIRAAISSAGYRPGRIAPGFHEYTVHHNE